MPKKLTDIDIKARIVPAAVRWPNDPVVHWDSLRDAVEAARALLAAVDANCRAIEKDEDLSIDGMRRRRAEIGRQALEELAEFAPVKKAERAVERAVETFEAAMIELPKAPAALADVAMAQELRQHIAKQKSPVDFVLNNLSDPRVIGAVLHAPPFLSGLNDEAFNLIRERARNGLHPEQVKRRQEAEVALAALKEGVEAAKRLVLDRTEASLDATNR